MYISSIEISNFRSFENLIVNFQDGLNVLIGHNNSGKTNLLQALSLIFDNRASKQLSIDDFHKYIDLEELKKNPPKISITVSLSQSDKEELGDELVTVSTWLTELKKPYKAQIQYQFFLPETEIDEYKKKIKDVDKLAEAWSVIERDFIRKYVYKIYVGDPKNKTSVDLKDLRKFDYQFLDAIRDVERDMLTGRQTLLKRIIDFYLDYEIKSNDKLKDEDKARELHKRRKEFKEQSDEMIQLIQERLKKGKKELLGYTEETGANYDNFSPDFEGLLTESDIFSVLELIVKDTEETSLPIENNGLGYNNLIYIALLLSKMQVESDGKYMGSNAKVFPMLVIEEPEAHLHPTMQSDFVHFLHKNLEKKKVQQVFVTTHSTHISSELDLDQIIVFYKENNESKVSYPGKVLEQEPESKKYIQRFLDATKSNMLFAEKIIFVEGITEQLLVPVFAEYMKKSLDRNRVAVINIGGRYFDHFLKLFDPSNKYSIKRKISYITDIDPMRRKKRGGYWNACYPYEMYLDTSKFKYKHNNIYTENFDQDNNYVKGYSQGNDSKTFEYQFALDNPNTLILVDNISNIKELKFYIEEINNAQLSDFLDRLSCSKENERIKESITESNWEENKKLKAIFASRYLNSISKGEYALDLAVNLKENLKRKGKILCIPKYITNAIHWVCD